MLVAIFSYFHNIGNMKTNDAVNQLAALAQEKRLDAFRALVQAGPTGLNPGDLVQRLGTSPATLSFHLKELRQAGLVDSRQEGRFLFYSARYDSVQKLLQFLSENCCANACPTNEPR